MIKKRFQLSEPCSKNRLCKCQQLDGIVIVLDDNEKPLSKNIAKYMPPIYNGCMCTLVDLDNELAELEKVNEDRKVGGEIGLYGVDAIGVMVRAEESGEIHQVVLEKEEGEKMLEYIRYMHMGVIKCWSVPLVGINLSREEDKG